MSLRKSLSAIDKLLVTADRFFEFDLIDSENFLFFSYQRIGEPYKSMPSIQSPHNPKTTSGLLITFPVLIFGFGCGFAKGKWALTDHNEQSFARDFFRDSGCHCTVQFGF